MTPLTTLLTVFTLAVSPSTPTVGGTVTFQGSFPQEAFRQAHNPQFPFNPTGYLFCTQAGVALPQQVVFFNKGAKLPEGGFLGTSFPLELSGDPSLPATCQITVGYWTYSNKLGEAFHQVSYLSFEALADVPLAEPKETL